MLAVLEAGLGFGFLGTVVGYLPTMYAAFAQRELEISLMDARAGSPPTAAEFLRRMRRMDDDRRLDEMLAGWERWSAQLLETHISYPQLAYYPSPHSKQTWPGALLTHPHPPARTTATSRGVAPSPPPSIPPPPCSRPREPRPAPGPDSRSRWPGTRWSTSPRSSSGGSRPPAPIACRPKRSRRSRRSSPTRPSTRRRRPSSSDGSRSCDASTSPTPGPSESSSCSSCHRGAPG